MWTKTDWTRREMLRRSFNGIGRWPGDVTSARRSPKQPSFPPKVKNVIFLFMSGGVSQVDTFEYKPALEKIAGPASTAHVRPHGRAAVVPEAEPRGAAVALSVPRSRPVGTKDFVRCSSI